MIRQPGSLYLAQVRQQLICLPTYVLSTQGFGSHLDYVHVKKTRAFCPYISLPLQVPNPPYIIELPLLVAVLCSILQHTAA